MFFLPPVPDGFASPCSHVPFRHTRPVSHSVVSSQLEPYGLPVAPGQPGRPGGQSSLTAHFCGGFLPGSDGASSISFLIGTLYGALSEPAVPTGSPASSFA